MNINNPPMIDDFANYIDPWSYPEESPDYHSINTIQVCELYNSGFFNNDDGSWNWPKYSDEQDVRLRKKLKEHYWFREIGITPPYVWKTKFVSRMNELMQTYIPMYQIVEETKDNLLQAAGTIHEEANTDNVYKGRTILSDFPETLLSANADYASNGSDSEDERIIDKTTDRIMKEDFIKRLEQFETDIANVDYQIIKRVEPMFSCLLSTYVNGM